MAHRFIRRAIRVNNVLYTRIHVLNVRRCAELFASGSSHAPGGHRRLAQASARLVSLSERFSPEGHKALHGAAGRTGTSSTIAPENGEIGSNNIQPLPLALRTRMAAVPTLSTYARRMARLSARIFGEVARPTDKSSMKVVALMSERPRAKLPEVANYYPAHPEYTQLMFTLRFHGLYRDEHQDFKEEMKRLKKLRGKGKPKKGEGKRAMQKK